MPRTLTAQQAQQFYDRFGAKQDKQAFYEDAAIDQLVEHAIFDRATAVVEFGCGTGRFARRLLSECLSGKCTYLGFDSSTTMTALTRERVSDWRDRARVDQTTGGVQLEVADGTADRIVSNYVLDLLSDEQVTAFVAEARRVLRPGGLLCLASLTHAAQIPSHVTIGLWRAVHAVRPQWVGGCRPVELLPFLAGQHWRVEFRQVVTRWTIPSEVVVAEWLP